MNVILKSLLGFCFTIISCSMLAQCADCQPDENCGDGANFPTICPEILPSGVAGEYYEEVLTFYLPSAVEDNGVSADLEQIVISSITGVPFGMEITINDDDNTYFPSQGENFGCATMCGTPLQDGLFDISINVLVVVTVFGFEQELNESFVLPLLIEEGELANSSFSFDQVVGCGELQVNFEALIDGSPNPTFYNWDFGNGNLSDQAAPAPQTYGPGEYSVTLQTTINQFVISQVIVNSLSSDGDGDADELFGLLAQDPYLVVLNEDGVAVYTSNSVDGSDSATFSGLNIILSNPGYSIQIWDSDTITADDLLGEYDLGDLLAGSFDFNDGGTQGSILVEEQINSQFTDSQAITVYEIPDGEFIYNDVLNVLSYNDPTIVGYTWTLNGDTLLTNGPVQELVFPGVYQCVVISEFGCEATSQEFVLCPEISIDIDFENQTFSTTSGFESYSWSYNGLPISDSNSAEVSYEGAGNYSVTITTDYGCTVTSEVLTIDLNIQELNKIDLMVFPNPTSDILRINSSINLSDLNVDIINSSGQTVLSVDKFSTLNSQIRVNDLSSGNYTIRLSNSNEIIAIQSFIKI